MRGAIALKMLFSSQFSRRSAIKITIGVKTTQKCFMQFLHKFKEA